MKYYFAFCVFIFSGWSHAQTLEWVQAYGGEMNDNGRFICTDAAGNVVSAGRFWLPIDFMPNGLSAPLTSNGGYDVFITKMDAGGNVLWAKSFGGPESDDVAAICSDAEGFIYLTGQYQLSVDFDPGAGTSELTSNGNFDAYILKLDPEGNFVWVRSFGGSGPDQPRSLGVDENGNVQTVGGFQGLVDFDPGLGEDIRSSQGQEDIFILSLNVSGALNWAKTYGTANADAAGALSIDANGDLVVGGWFRNAINFDSEGSDEGMVTSSSANWDASILKLNPDGGFVWVKSVGGEDQERVLAVDTDDLGNVLATGFFEGTADFNPGATTANLTSAQNSDDTFILKLSPAGDYIWARSLRGGPQNNYGNAISADAAGNVYTAGTFFGEVDFDPSSASLEITASFANLYVHKMDAGGNFQWVYTTQGGGDDRGASMALSGNGDIYVTGEFKSSVDFDGGLDVNEWTATGDEEDVYMLKLTPETTNVQGIEAYYNIEAYPNPSSGAVQLRFHTPLQDVNMKLTDARGSLIWEQYLPEIPEQFSIELGHRSGLYILHLRSHDVNSSLKLLRF